MRVMKAKCQGARDESEGAEHGSEGVSPGCLVCVCVQGWCCCDLQQAPGIRTIRDGMTFKDISEHVQRVLFW